MSILIVEDNSINAMVLENLLTKGGYHTTVAKSALDALACLPHMKDLQLMITDLSMPDMDGFTILEKLRESPTLREIPVLVVSGGGLTNEQHQQLADYGQRLITKGSLKENELIASIENALKRIG